MRNANSLALAIGDGTKDNDILAYIRAAHPPLKSQKNSVSRSNHNNKNIDTNDYSRNPYRYRKSKSRVSLEISQVQSFQTLQGSQNPYYHSEREGCDIKMYAETPFILLFVGVLVHPVIGEIEHALPPLPKSLTECHQPALQEISSDLSIPPQICPTL
jgi:hypothetical protein